MSVHLVCCAALAMLLDAHMTDQLSSCSSSRMNSEQSMFVKIELFGLEMRIAQVRFKDADPAPFRPCLRC
jgi:hypothetical protein